MSSPSSPERSARPVVSTISSPQYRARLYPTTSQLEPLSLSPPLNASSTPDHKTSLLTGGSANRWQLSARDPMEMAAIDVQGFSTSFYSPTTLLSVAAVANTDVSTTPIRGQETTSIVVPTSSGTSSPPLPPMSLIPEGLPNSPLLYVLTTSEGRDKLFKCLQYTLKLLIVVLHVDFLYPQQQQLEGGGTGPLVAYWTTRFAGNNQTIRNGRAMFRLGRWLITLFHLQVVLSRVLSRCYPTALQRMERTRKGVARYIVDLVWKNTSTDGHDNHKELFPLNERTSLEDVQPVEEGRRQALVEPMRSEMLRVHFSNPIADSSSPIFHVEDVSSAVTTQAQGNTAGHNCAAAASAAPIFWRRTILDFPLWLMLLLGVRCLSSMLRNGLRDVLFLKSKELFGFRYDNNIVDSESIRWLQGGFFNSRARMQSVSNAAWLVTSAIDCVINLSRLSSRSWIKEALTRDTKFRCGCKHHELRRKSDIFFPPLDLDFGSVEPTTAKIFEAAPPETMKLSCKLCSCVLEIDEEYDVIGASDITNPRSDITNPRSAVEPYHRPPNASLRQSLMAVPWLIRQAYSLMWCVGNHDNLYHTLLLQLRYGCDLFLSWGNVFGERERMMSGGSGLFRAFDQHAASGVAGLISAVIALNRVIQSCPQR